MDAPAHQARIRLSRDRSALLDNRRRTERRLDFALPRRGFAQPAEHDSLPAVFVVGLEQELLALVESQRDEIHQLAAIERTAFLDAARPRDMLRNRGALDAAEQFRIALVAQHREACLL